MPDLHDDGGFASYVGRPLGQIAVPPTYNVVFFNKMLDAPLEKLNLTSVTSTIVFDEQLGDTNVKYERVLHYYITDRATGKVVAGPRYVPYISSWTGAGAVTTYTLKPLIEVNNPRFVKASENVFMSYFFSNFTTAALPDSQYTDDPRYLRRLIEFASNEVDEVFGNSPSGLSDPLPNNKNYAYSTVPNDNTPRIAFLSALMRMFVVKMTEGSSSASPTDTIALLFEKPQILTWVGHRFALDFHPPMLVNRTQEVRWASSKASSDLLDPDAVDDSPPRQIPYHHVVSGLESIMYPGYGGLNFYTKPIHEIYDVALDHVFQIGGDYQKVYNIYTDTNRRIESIGIRQKNLEGLWKESSSSAGVYIDPFEFECTSCQGSSSSCVEHTITNSVFSPAQRHFIVIEIDMDDFRNFSSSSSSSSFSYPEYDVIVPPSLDPRLPDKPSWWSEYWQECGSGGGGASSGGGVGGIVRVEHDGLRWYGSACIDGVVLYATIEHKPFGYLNEAHDRYWLTIGVKSAFDVDLDLLWQGYWLEFENPEGDYVRYWALAESAPDTITVQEV
jgi:hypothetical protein